MARRILVTRVDHKAVERVFDFAMLHFPTPLPRPWEFQIGVSVSAPEARSWPALSAATTTKAGHAHSAA